MAKFDDILHEIGGFGKYQKIRVGFICISGILAPIIAYLHLFAAPNIKHR